MYVHEYNVSSRQIVWQLPAGNIVFPSFFLFSVFVLLLLSSHRMQNSPHARWFPCQCQCPFHFQGPSVATVNVIICCPQLGKRVGSKTTRTAHCFTHCLQCGLINKSTGSAAIYSFYSVELNITPLIMVVRLFAQKSAERLEGVSRRSRATQAARLLTHKLKISRSEESEQNVASLNTPSPPAGQRLPTGG